MAEVKRRIGNCPEAGLELVHQPHGDGGDPRRGKSLWPWGIKHRASGAYAWFEDPGMVILWGRNMESADSIVAALHRVGVRVEGCF